MTMSEKIAYESIEKLETDKAFSESNLGFILTVARDNGNWDLIDKLITKYLVG